MARLRINGDPHPDQGTANLAITQAPSLPAREGEETRVMTPSVPYSSPSKSPRRTGDERCLRKVDFSHVGALSGPSFAHLHRFFMAFR